ncbi:MAG: rhamnulokinase family protein, partial [bacterium]
TDIFGRKHWDIARLFEEVKNCIGIAGNDISSVGIDTWGVDYGYIAPDGDLAGLPFAYRDSIRCNAHIDVHELIPLNDLYSITGIQFLPFNAIYQIADDLKYRPELIENSDKLLMMPELLGYLLTGEAVGEYTNASTTGLLDASTHKWSIDILSRLGFPRAKLPEIVAPGKLKVPIVKSIKDETGTNADFIFTACHDTASAVAGIPVSNDKGNWAYISSGTWSLVGTELDNPILTESARNANFTNEGGVNGKIRFLKNVTGLWLIEELRRSWAHDGKKIDFDSINYEAEKAIPFRSLINPNHQSFISPDDMPKAIVDFCRSTNQPEPGTFGEFSRCVFESLALSYKHTIEKLEKITGKNIELIHIVGGGSKNELLCKMTADACGVRVIAGPSECTSIGNILVQALTHGSIDNLTGGRVIAANSLELKEFLPKDRGLWKEASGRFESLIGE